MGRPARARPGPRRPRRGLAQGLAGGRAGVVRRGADRLARRRLAVPRRRRDVGRALLAAGRLRGLLRPRPWLRAALRRSGPRRGRRAVAVRVLPVVVVGLLLSGGCGGGGGSTRTAQDVADRLEKEVPSITRTVAI